MWYLVLFLIGVITGYIIKDVFFEDNGGMSISKLKIKKGGQATIDQQQVRRGRRKNKNRRKRKPQNL